MPSGDRILTRGIEDTVLVSVEVEVQPKCSVEVVEDKRVFAILGSNQ